MTGLKIACLTPWTEKSAIAGSAALVVAELERRGHEVTVFRIEQGDALALPSLPATRQVQLLDAWSSNDVRDVFEVRLAHIGDNLGFHAGLVRRLRDLAAVGIFHDAYLADLAYCWAEGDERILREMVSQTYADGNRAWPPGTPFMGESQSEVMAHRPMLEWLARHAVGAVAHAEHYADRLRSSCKGPVAVIPLAFEYHGLPDPPPPSRRIMVATVGHANANKRIDQLILGIAASPTLRSTCRIKIIGDSSDAERRRLTWMSECLGIVAPLFTGWVSEDELRWQLRDVDVISCLRNPVLEGASASLILAMASRRPTLVSDHGCYGEQPDDTVLKCAPGREAVDVMRHLERFVRNPQPYREMGARAAAFAVRQHSAQHYVERLQPLLEEVVASRPCEQAERRLSEALGGFGVAEDDSATTRALDVLHELLKGRAAAAA